MAVEISLQRTTPLIVAAEESPAFVHYFLWKGEVARKELVYRYRALEEQVGQWEQSQKVYEELQKTAMKSDH